MASNIVLNLKGVILPLNLLKCKSCLETMKKGDLLEVLLTDKDAAEKIKTIISRSKDKIIYEHKHEDTICLGIKKGNNSCSRI